MEKNQYRFDIDGLRAIAVMIVIFYHAKIPGFKGGYVGVDVFFVISGYLITKILLKEAIETSSISLSNFIKRRIRRLFPALILVIIVSVAFWAIFFTGLTTETTKFVNSIPYSVTGLANFFFLKNTGGYFDGANDEMPLLHFWSLAVEEQFYVVYPLLILGITKFSKNIRNSLKNFHIFTLVISLVLSIWMLKNNWKLEAFYLMPPRAWEFSIGALILFLPKKIFVFLKSRPIFFDFLGAIGIAAILYSTYKFNELTRFPGLKALYPTIGTCLILLISEAEITTGKIYNFLSNKIMVFTGGISYGLYLWHQPLLAFARIFNFGRK